MNDRSAPATVKGFLAQAVRTVELWLDLREGETLVCEGLEDADVIGGQATSHYQYKELSDQVSAKDLRDVIAAFLEGYVAALRKGTPALFVFVSPADARGAVARRAGNEELLRVWHDLDGMKLAAAVRALFKGWGTTASDKRISKKARLAALCLDEVDDGWVGFRKSVLWGFGSDTFEDVELRLVERLRSDRRAGHLADAALGRLVHQILRASSRKCREERHLTSVDRERLLDNLRDASQATWTQHFLEELARDAYEKELAAARRRIAALIERHQVSLPRQILRDHLTDTMQSAPHVVVAGRRGVGKSQLVARVLKDKRACWLDADDIGRTNRQMDSALPAEVRSRLNDDAGYLVIDGVEMANQEQLAQIRSLASQMDRTRFVLTVRSLTRTLDREVELALPRATTVEVPRLDETELAAICELVNQPPPGADLRPLVCSLYFFWLAQDLHLGSATTERGLLEHFWSDRGLSGAEVGLLEVIAAALVARQARRHVFDSQQRDNVRSLISCGLLVEDPRNPLAVSFAHDVLLDFAIAHHVLQPKTAAGTLAGWLQQVDVVQRSWCLPSIAFEAERCFVADSTSYWSIACELCDHDVLVDWLSPASLADLSSINPLIAALERGDARAATVLQRLSVGESI
jgi:hypothetical protein